MKVGVNMNKGYVLILGGSEVSFPYWCKVINKVDDTHRTCGGDRLDSLTIEYPTSLEKELVSFLSKTVKVFNWNLRSGL